MKSSALHTTSINQDSAVSYAIDIVDLNKSFRRGGSNAKSGYTSLKSWLLSLFTPKAKNEAEVQAETTRAISDLTLRIPLGASVGLIGRNGSGKSTFLKLLTGIYQPDSGKISVNGKIAALIELGAGFHPDFTGRENVMLGGVMHGLTRRQVLDRFDEIVAFAELEKFIDDPVRTYSSGMFMRLGFSLAVHTDPDILLIDEVLAVGDAGFVKKCKDKISEMRSQGKTLVLVTHDLDAVERWCDEVIWLNQGEVKERGEPRRVIDAYRTFLEGRESTELKVENIAQTQDVVTPGSDAAYSFSRWGSREIEILDVKFSATKAEGHLVLHPEEGAEIDVRYKINEKVNDVVFGVGIHRSDGLMVFGSNTDIEKLPIKLGEKEGTIKINISRIGLLEGKYYLDVAVHRQDGYPFDYQKNVLSFSVQSPRRYAGVMLPEYKWAVGE